MKKCRLTNMARVRNYLMTKIMAVQYTDKEMVKNSEKDSSLRAKFGNGHSNVLVKLHFS